MSTIFTPIAGDKFAVESEIGVEYAIEKSSGYLDRVGVGPRALAAALYYSNTHGGRTVVGRIIGTTDWEVQPQAEAPETFEVPDALPDDFA